MLANHLVASLHSKNFLTSVHVCKVPAQPYTNMLTAIIAPLLVSAVAANGHSDSRPPWITRSDPPAQRAKLLLNEMNMTEKLHMLHGNNTMQPYVGAVTGNARLGIPDLTLNDGPQGFRDNDGHKGTSTQMPSGLSIGATWNPDQAQLWGKTMGEEFLGKGSNVQLGPGMCVARVPYNGRNFEYLSGEDPHLGYVMAGAAVQGIQSTGVIANAKHYVLNSQETNRTTQSAIVDERTLHEIYLPPFEGAVAAGVGSVMCSYNKIGTVWSCENATTLAGALKKDLGFDGFVMSDWGATHSASINQGLDMEMPGGSKMTGKPDATGVCRHDLCELIQNGTVTEATVNASVLRILTPMFRMGLFDRKPSGDITANVTSDTHNAAVRKLAAASMVLLKNENNVLPLKVASGDGNGGGVNTIAVIGAQATTPVTGGGGSGSVAAPYIVAPLDGIERRFNKSHPPSPQPAPTPAPKCGGAPTHPDSDIDGHDLLEPPAHVADFTACCALCTKTDKCVAYSFNQDGSCYLKSATYPVSQRGGQSVGVLPQPAVHGIVFDDGQNMSQAAEVAAGADVAIVFASTKSGEGHDRFNLNLYDGWNGDNNSYSYDKLIETVSSSCAKNNTPVVVVAVSPGAILTPWRDSVQGLVAAFMPGQEYGNAIADLLFGDVAFEGRLPMTFPTIDNQWGFVEAQYPGIHDVSVYTEKLNVGYRYYDTNNLEPAYPFGHGLTYTTFEYSGVKADATSVNLTLKNSGSRDGVEVVQLYLGFPDSAGEPPRQLKSFQRVALAAGASTDVHIALDDRALSIWDTGTHSWAKVSGNFQAYVGRSSRDLRLNATFTVQ